MSGQTKCYKCGLSYDGAVCPLCAPAKPFGPLGPVDAELPRKAKAPPARVEYIQKSKVKAKVNALGKRCGDDFLLALDDVVRRKIASACRMHNGGRKTLDASVLRVLK